MSKLPKIQPSEFYASFMRLFHDYLSSQPKHVDDMYQDTGLWTKFMLHNLLPQIIEDVGKRRLEYKHEFKNLDLCAWDTVAEPFDQTDLNQWRYGLPLYVHLVIEHENGPYPNEEFWKLLHLYAPLKVIVCHLSSPRLAEWLAWFNRMRDRVGAFHPRSSDDAYLVIVGRCGAVKPSELDWQGYKVEAGQQRFAQIKLT